jgi:transcriptional regulator GlxA family with amidase domain
VEVAGNSAFRACARDLATLHRALAASDGPPDVLPDADRQLRAGRQLVSWVADRLLGVRSHASAPALGFRRVRQVEEWVDAHLAAPITLGDLCAAAGVGDRWLESAFKRWRDQAPLEFVASRRLAATRRRLGDPLPGDTVARIALDAGFVHLGRFAAHYRKAYGESPSATLRRSAH